MNVLNACSTAAALLTRHDVVVVVIAVVIAVVVAVIIAVVILVIIANPVASVVCIPSGATSAIKTAVDAWPLVSVRASHRIVLVAITPRYGAVPIVVILVFAIANPVASVVCIPSGVTSATKTAVDAWPLVSVRASHRIVLVAITPRYGAVPIVVILVFVVFVFVPVVTVPPIVPVARTTIISIPETEAPVCTCLVRVARAFVHVKAQVTASATNSIETSVICFVDAFIGFAPSVVVPRRSYGLPAIRAPRISFRALEGSQR